MENLIFITLVFILAGTVKGVTGMGLPTVAVALLTLRLAPMEAAGLLIVPSVLTNVWQLLSGPRLYALLLRMRSLLLGCCLGIAVVGAVGVSAAWSAGALGLALLAYGALGLGAWRWRVPARRQRWMAPLAGAATGLLGGGTGVFVMPVVPYLQALELERDELVQAMGLSFCVSTMAMAVMLASRGQWHPVAAGSSFLALLPALAGMRLGQWLRGKMPALLFRRCLFVTLMVLGLNLLWRALHS
ncbi:sulfite exporter TauE/SafE family protein [Oxalobacteraceae bacterium A2-2]